MPSWKKVLTSGSDASLNSLTVINGITGSLFGTSSFATTASYATSINFLNQDVSITGSLTVSGSTTLSGSLNVSGSITATGNQTTTGYLLIGSGSANNTPFYGVAPNAVIGMNTGTAGAVLELRNTSQSISAGSILGTIQFTAAGGGGVYSSAQIRSTVTTSPGSGNSGGGNLLFLTTPSTSGGIVERMRINSSGNVGIGTISPVSKLQVAGTSTYNSDSVKAFRVSDSSTITKAVDIGFDTTLDRGFIQAGDFGTSYKDLLLNPNVGNVGIGTTVPFTKLQVSGSVQVGTYTANLNSYSNGLSVTNPGATATSLFLYQAGVASGHIGLRASDTNLYIVNSYTNGLITNPAAIALTSTGNVGIGKTNPSTTLDVSGSVSVTGSLLVTGSTTVAGNIVPSTDIVYQLGTSALKFSNIFGTTGTLSSIYTGNINSNSTGGVNIKSVNNLIWGKWFDGTGNLSLQSGSATAPTDDGVNRLQVSGSARISHTGATPLLIERTGGSNSNIQFKNDANSMFAGGRSTSFGIGPAQDLLTTSQLTVFGGTGNVVIQNGGTPVDTGYRLDVSGSSRHNGDTTITGSLNVTGSTTVTGNIAPSANNIYDLGSSTNNFLRVRANNIVSNVGSLSIWVQHTSGAPEIARFHNNTGNLALQPSGSTFTDDGINRLQVSGSARITNGLTVTGSLLISSSAGITVDGINIGRGGGYNSSNTIIGNSAGLNNSTGGANTFIGYLSGQFNNSGSQNTFMGQNAGGLNTSGNNNTNIGVNAGFANTTGVANVFLGRDAGRFITDKSTPATSVDRSIMLGYRTSPLGDSQTNQIVIGYDSTGLGSNTTVLGNTSTVTAAIYGNLLLGTTTDVASSKLTVNSKWAGV